MRLADLKPTPRRVTGPGTSTSDSVPAQVAETGEPLLVSNQERILSTKQEALLQQIAQLLGFDSVDAMLEAGTGLPVGPTVKKGKKAAATGMGPEEQLTGLQAATRPIQPGETGVEMINGVRHSTTPAVKAPALGAAAGETLNKVTGGAFDFEGRAQANRESQLAQLNPPAPVPAPQGQAAPPAFAALPVAARSPTSEAGGGLNAFEDKGGGILRQIGRNGGVSLTNVGTEGGADTNKAAPVATGIDLAGSNAALARANAARQSLIDSQRGSVGVIDAPSPAGGGDDRMLRELYDATQHGKRSERANATSLLNNLLNQRGVTTLGRVRLDQDQQRLDQERESAQQRSALEAARLAQGLPAMEGQQLQNEQGRLLAGLQKKAIAGDQQALATLQAMNSKEKAPRYTTSVVHGAMGQPSTLVVTGPDGLPVMAGTGDEITKWYAQQSQAAQVPPPEKRSVGTVYQTPKGPMVWRGNGWEAA